MTRVTVGMDESQGVAQALKWAVGESAGRDWHISSTPSAAAPATTPG